MIKKYQANGLNKMVGTILIMLGLMLYSLYVIPVIVDFLYDENAISFRLLESCKPAMKSLSKNMHGRTSSIWKTIINMLFASGLVIVTLNYDGKRKRNTLVAALICLWVGVVLYTALQNRSSSTSYTGYADFYDFYDADNVAIGSLDIPWWFLITAITCLQLYLTRTIQIDESSVMRLPKGTSSILLCSGAYGCISLLLTMPYVGAVVLVELACCIFFLIRKKQSTVVLKAAGYFALLLLIVTLIAMISVETDNVTLGSLSVLVDISCIHYFLFMHTYAIIWLLGKRKLCSRIPDRTVEVSEQQ